MQGMSIVVQLQDDRSKCLSGLPPSPPSPATPDDPITSPVTSSRPADSLRPERVAPAQVHVSSAHATVYMDNICTRIKYVHAMNYVFQSVHPAAMDHCSARA